MLTCATTKDLFLTYLAKVEMSACNNELSVVSPVIIIIVIVSIFIIVPGLLLATVLNLKF